MQIDRLILKDVFAYTQPVELDLAALGPGVIAIRGDNGSGKTALAEIVPAVNWQKLPARDNDHPKAYATSRQARLEYHFRTDDGTRYRALLSMDAESGGVDGLLARILDDGREVPVNDGKVSTLKPAIAQLFPSYDLFINSCFAAQGRGDELARTPQTKRKDLFAEFLGLAVLLERAKTASDAAAECARVRDRLLVRRDELAQATADGVVMALDRRAQTLIGTRDAAWEDRNVAQQSVATLEARLATMQDAVAAHGAITLRRQSLTTDLTARRSELVALEQQRATADQNYEAALALAEQQRSDRVYEINAKRVAADATLAGEQARIEQTRAAKVADCEAKIAGNQQLRERRAEILAALEALPALEAALQGHREAARVSRLAREQAAAALRVAERQLAALAPVEQQHQRATSDASLLEHVPCHGDGAYAACELLQNAQRAKGQLQDLVAQLAPKAALADEVGRLTREMMGYAGVFTEADSRGIETERQIAALQQLAKYAPALEQSDARVAELEQLREQALTEALGALVAAQQRHDAAVADLDAAQRVADADRETACADASRRRDEYVTHLDRQRESQQARVAALEADLAAADADLAAVRGGHQEATTLQQQLAGARTALEQVVTAIASADAGLQHVARERAALDAQRARLGEVAQRLALVDQALVEWRDLGKATGKGGLVDLEIDAAGPEISATANALLMHCMHGRFSIELVTQVEKKDGGEMRDSFTCRVIDNKKADGRWRELKQLSGGEKTIVQEALMCALALYVNQHSLNPMRTFWRDETGSALDEVNALQYVDMLRKVREIGGLDKVFYISHNRAAADLADAQIVVAGGTASIVLPPYSTTSREAA